MVALCSSHSEGLSKLRCGRSGDCERAGAANDELPKSCGVGAARPGGWDGVDVTGPSSDAAATVPEDMMADAGRSAIRRTSPAV